MALKALATARDVMTRRVVSVASDTPLAEVARILDRRQISGMPVLSREGHILGVVSRTDLLRHDTEREPGLRAADAMTPWAVSLEETAPIGELARQMLAKRIHRVLITRDGRLVGIVTSLDLLRAYVGGRHAAVPA